MRVREIRLKSRPVGMPTAENFEIAEVETAAPGPGEALVRNLWMSVDPYMRGRMYDRASYVPPFQVGEALQGGAIGEVLTSNDPGLKQGDLVESMLGWREAYSAPAGMLTRLPESKVPPQAFLGVLGMPGLTAYAGLLEIGQPKEGETVFVSGAAGAVGSVVCQIAKIKGCRVVASVGSAAKGDWLRSVGVDAVVNYKDGDLLANVRAAAPKGVDVYFDNVGGAHLEVALEVARPFARFVECGMISQYNNTAATPGPSNMTNIVGKSLKLQGFIVLQYAHLRDQFRREMIEWIEAGKVKWEETVESGIERAPGAFLNLFTGANTGKMLVKLA
ncbi:MAG: NADP-dependent oxidoreductase [Hyphomonadaceae bacterium]|nr:NADP-dependent oxidoreductase [Hyphomonadaceae bacterium]